MAESTSSWVSSTGARPSSKGPPVPAREGPLDYAPAVICRCGLKAPRRVSWSDDNPGRRNNSFLMCFVPLQSSMDCKFFSWFDGEHSEFMKTLLIDLRNAVWRIKAERDEVDELQSVDVTVSRELEDQKKMNQSLQEEREGMKKKLAEKDELLQAMAMKMCAGDRSRSVCSFVCVFVVGVMLGVMLGVVMA
ncbi:hypothetical protein PVAP13_5NG207600 [Panicum virgatum]|uniref:Zinc finger GRF-type domain-containing protein n=1 Tax=Panicum virgatum TaxID=38727 RepID=A0A8T0RTW9_PANVG|nr:hypothetical protein PVAP13_5NG207600 [Panicum virgatum]